jgi:hypothetical protein
MSEIWYGRYAIGDFQIHTFCLPAVGNTNVTVA